MAAQLIDCVLTINGDKGEDILATAIVNEMFQLPEELIFLMRLGDRLKLMLAWFFLSLCHPQVI